MWMWYGICIRVRICYDEYAARWTDILKRVWTTAAPWSREAWRHVTEFELVLLKWMGAS